MITTSTYIKKNGVLSVPLDEISKNSSRWFSPLENGNCLKDVTDFLYLEGAIILKINQNFALDFRHWDLVDQLWAYLLNSTEELLAGCKETSFFFPDQPLEVKIKVIDNGQLYIRIGVHEYIADQKEFIDTIIRDGISFFTILGKYSIYHKQQKEVFCKRFGEIGYINL